MVTQKRFNLQKYADREKTLSECLLRKNETLKNASMTADTLKIGRKKRASNLALTASVISYCEA